MPTTSTYVRRLTRRAYRRLRGAGRPEPPAPGGPTVVRGLEPGPDLDRPPWLPLPRVTDGVLCNICRWQGDAFIGPRHCEASRCPGCGSIGRDRFLHWCFTQRVEVNAGLRLIEFSPRLGRPYREAMGTWFFYRTSDYDFRLHAGNLQLDLQDIDLPDSCVDVVFCAHVFEHLAETGKALDELRRVLVPGGHLLLQVPVLQGRTAPPEEPELHEDNSPVHWRFGFDLTTQLRDQGFSVELLCLQGWADAVADGAAKNPWPDCSPEFDVPDMLEHAVADDLTVVGDADRTTVLGLDPAYMYLTWDCRVSGLREECSGGSPSTPAKEESPQNSGR